MSGRIRTFGEKVPFEIDKLDGFHIGKEEPSVRIRGWDEFRFSGRVEGILRSPEGVLWAGDILTQDEINEIFVPYPNPHRELARTIRMRSGNYGKPKNAGFVRLQTEDAKGFSLVRTNSGEEPQRTLAEIDGGIPDELYLEVVSTGNNRVFALYQVIEHGRKIQKILENGKN